MAASLKYLNTVRSKPGVTLKTYTVQRFDPRRFYDKMYRVPIP
ncbi:hypothetical protein LX87_05303 [Larkinella arboricola]|uniref:Uncharacterized protein n=1 Tax=Larkinella arboricola TaxID=643671 RepID=A0A327WLA8_LARAB|nr:hypothetical protein LX87_05303 [Larkinella arboricola]